MLQKESWGKKKCLFDAVHNWKKSQGIDSNNMDEKGQYRY